MRKVCGPIMGSSQTILAIGLGERNREGVIAYERTFHPSNIIYMTWAHVNLWIIVLK